MIKNIIVQICAENEWQVVKSIFLELNGKLVLHFSPFGEYFSAKINSTNCILFNSGASKTLSSSACQYAISTWNPEIIFVLGTAGAISENLKPRDVVIADRTVQYDCISRIGDDSELFYKDFVVNMLNPWLSKHCNPSDFYLGTIASADQDVDGRVREILKPNNILAADWESGAIVPVCKLNETSCCIIRGISDVPGNKTSQEQFNDFKKNTPIVMRNLINDILPKMIDIYLKSPSATIFS